MALQKSNMTDEEKIRELLTSNAELRAALILAGREIRKLNFGKKETPVLKILRRTLRVSRELARRVKGT